MFAGNRILATAMAGWTLFAALLTTAAAAPQTGKKPAEKKTAKKPAAKKDDTKALIAEGKKVYEKNSCSACHAIGGKGATSGPDLTKVGANPKHTAKWLEEAIVNPKADNPNSTMPSYADTIKGKDRKALIAYLASLK